MSKKIEKHVLVNNEIERLNKILQDIDENRRDSAEGLIQEASFMRATLVELKESIDENGPIDEMPQGEYSILREHPALKSYNTMIQRYSSVLKQLTDLLPKEVPKEVDDGFEDFVKMK